MFIIGICRSYWVLFILYLLLCSRYWSVLRLFHLVFMDRIILFANRNSLTSSFPIFILLILIIALWHLVLHWIRVEKWIPLSLIYIKWFTFLPFSIVLAIGLCDLLCWGMILLFLDFIMKGWILSLFSPWIYWWSCDLCESVSVIYCICWFLYANLLLYPRNWYYLVIVKLFFYMK